MKNTTKNPIVFLDVAVSDEKLGRLVIELFKDKVPLTAENFRALCTGEKGLGKNNKPLHYKGSLFHKVVRQLMVQGGDIINFDGSSGESIYGLHFKDENLTMLHDQQGLLSMVNEGKPNSNSSQFVITIGPCPQLNNTNVVFGKVLKGIGVIKDLNGVPINDDVPEEEIKITDCGELINCDNWGLEDNDGEDIYTPYPEDWNLPTKNELSYKNILDIVQKIKNVGNACFIKKKYTIAAYKYKKALRYYKWMMTFEDTPKTDKSIVELNNILLLNLAAVRLRQARYKDAINLCNEVLFVDVNSSKALFRRGQAYSGLNEYKLALTDLRKAIKDNPTNKEISKEIQRIKNVMKSYLAIEKATFQRMFKIN
ncbi:peptidyl-prolyl cis-trans isomerase D [Phymastichus coffea]|uniref:peptidyl-prolyl cis-trans isomerase D n=1 Tax=Phymastichus coffea TaxID=108790 RepID=UPI00273C2A37|nr:peptidyl-prolyl cis-trans isomerase D [Phymastichus coffea]